MAAGGFAPRSPQSSNKPTFAQRTTPVLIVLLFIAWAYTSYMVAFLECFSKRYPTLGLTYGLVCSGLTAMTVWSYLQAVLTHPGTVPADRFGFSPQNSPIIEPYRAKCDICQVYKPLRTHHCSKCQQCILQYDHHCPWINNCVGFRNKKFFMLFVGYASLDVAFVCTTSAREVLVFHSERSLRLMSIGASINFSLMWALSVLTGLSLLTFCAVHCKLLLENRTTVEAFLVDQAANPYDMGMVANLQQACGRNPFLWWLPIGPRHKEEDGTYWRKLDPSEPNSRP